MYVIGILCLMVVVYCVIFLKKLKYIDDCLKCFPGPPTVFFFGNALDFVGDRGLLDVARCYTRDYGSVVKGQFGPIIFGLAITDYDFTKQVLLANKNLSKGAAYNLTKFWLGDGLLTSDEEKWRIQRKVLAPAFNNQMLMDFITVFDQQSDTLVETVEKIAPCDSYDIHNVLSLCTLDIICDTTMGVSIYAQKNEESEYTKSVKELCRTILERSICIWKHIDPLFMLSADYRKQQKCLKIIRNYTNHVINQRKKQRAELKQHGCIEETDEFGRKRKMALLDILLDYSETDCQLSQKEIEDEVHTFMFAGHDTVTATMNYLIYELARNPDIQKLVYQEQLAIFGGDMHRETKFSDIQEMRYLNLVIKETLRMYPAVSLILRVITEDFVFKGHVIPKGTVASFFIYGLHRNPKLFPNPDVFDPTRFENPDVVAPLSFIPFSAGPRNCIGQKFAMYEMKVIISKLIRNFEFSPTIPEHLLDLRAEVVLTSRSGVKVKIAKRKH